MLVPADSGIGNVGRPRAVGPQGGRIASLETFFNFYINNVPAPDEAKAMNPNIETAMRMHPDVAAALEKRTFSVSAMPWHVEPNPEATDKHIATVVADHCRKVIKKIPNFAQAIEHLQYAILVGGQGLEVVWRQEGEVEVPVSIHPVHMSRFSFDRLGNMALLTRYTPVWGAYVSGNPQWQYGQQLPRGRFIYHVYKQGQGQWDRPDLAGYEYFGIGLDVALYYVVTFDIYCLKFRMKFLERYGIPPTVLYVPDNKMTSKEVLKIADSLRGESLVTIPRTMGTSANPDNFNSLYKVDQMPVPTGSYDFFQSFSDTYTLPRVNAIMLGSSSEAKSGSQDSKGEGYSSDVSKRDAGPNIWYKRDAGNIGETMTDQFIPSIVLGRFPGMPPENWPIFSIKPKEEKDRKQEIDIAMAVSKLVPLSEDYIYDISDSPKPQPGQKTIGGMQQQPGGMPGMPGAQPPPGNGNGAKPAFPGMPKQAIGDGGNGGKGAVVNRGF